MSRRASLLAKQEKRKPRVRFPDELVFLDNIKDNDIQACHSMLRRASVQLDLNGLDTSGLTPLHNAVLEGNLGAVELLVQHGADVNRQDADTWTPLHAACANGEADIARFLLSRGASKDIKTTDGERPLDLCDARDFSVISVMLESETSRLARMLSAPDEDDEDNEDLESSDENTENADSQPITKGINELKVTSTFEDVSGTNTPRTLSTPQSILKEPHRAASVSPSSSRASSKGTSVSSTRKSPTSTPTMNNRSPLRSSPGTSRKSPSHSPGALRKSPIDHSVRAGNTSGLSSTPTISLGRTNRGSSNSNRNSGNDNSGSTSSHSTCAKSQITTNSRAPKPPGHSILKKTSTQQCHTVAE